MKKVCIIIITFAFLSLLEVKAEGSMKVSKKEVKEGDTFTVTITISKAAEWNVNLTSKGPVSGCKISEEGSTIDDKNTKKVFTANCKATGEGIIKLILTGDTTNEKGVTKALEGSSSILVEKMEGSTTQNISEKDNTSNKKSSNVTIKSIMMDNYPLSITNGYYTLTVPNSVEKGLFKIELEDSKSSATRIDNVNLKVGENNFKVTVTAEDGTTKDYAIKVIRKEIEYSIRDIATVLEKTASYPIIIKENDILTKETLEIIKNSHKKLELIRYNEQNKELYKWIIDGNKLDQLQDLNTSVNVTNFNKNNEIGIELLTKNDVPKGIELSIMIDENNKKVLNYQLLTYESDSNSTKVVKNRLITKDGRITITPTEHKYLLKNIPVLIVWSEVILGSIVAFSAIAFLIALSFVNKLLMKRKKIQS